MVVVKKEESEKSRETTRGGGNKTKQTHNLVLTSQVCYLFNSFCCAVFRKDLKSLDSDGDETFLNCGKSVNLTYFDSLLGISNRANHPNVEETKVLLIQHKNFTQAQMRDFCSKLKKEIRVMPKSLERNIRIGNFWRYKGDTKKAVECFRKVLSVSPNNSEVS